VRRTAKLQQFVIWLWKWTKDGNNKRDWKVCWKDNKTVMLEALGSILRDSGPTPIPASPLLTVRASQGSWSEWRRTPCGTNMEETWNVCVTEGELRGKEAVTVLGTTFCSFKGVPYAKPPLGPLRFSVSTQRKTAVTKCTPVTSISRPLLPHGLRPKSRDRDVIFWSRLIHVAPIFGAVVVTTSDCPSVPCLQI
jgi:hypothetical protein